MLFTKTTWLTENNSNRIYTIIKLWLCLSARTVIRVFISVKTMMSECLLKLCLLCMHLFVSIDIMCVAKSNK